MFDQLIDHLISGAEHPLRSSLHISRQRGQKAARRKNDCIKCKKGRNPKSRGEVRDRLPMAQERQNRTRHDHTKQRQPPESCRRQQQPPTSSNPPQTMLKPSGKPQRAKSVFTVPRPIILMMPATTNITAKAAVRIVGVSEMSFAIMRCTCLCIRQLPAFTYGEYGFFANFINQLTASANNQHRMLPCTPNAMACYWR
jgi:hypothetical protein